MDNSLSLFAYLEVYEWRDFVRFLAAAAVTVIT